MELAGLIAGALHVYSVPAGIIVVGEASTGVTVKAPPLQIDAVCAGTKGDGFTVTVTVKVEPTQLPKPEGFVGVTV